MVHWQNRNCSRNPVLIQFLDSILAELSDPHIYGYYNVMLLAKKHADFELCSS